MDGHPAHARGLGPLGLRGEGQPPQEPRRRGKLVKTPDTSDLRTDKTDTWRAGKEREAFEQATDQADLDRRLAELDGQQVDHAQDLQLGGADSPDNMWGIDAATNHGMGGQLRQQLAQVPNGEQIQINVVHDKYSPKR
nr:hypothetical protein GCM10025732_34320 [Glycomyces mayteni]